MFSTLEVELCPHSQLLPSSTLSGRSLSVCWLLHQKDEQVGGGGGVWWVGVGVWMWGDSQAILLREL